MLSLGGQCNYKMQKIKIPSLNVFQYKNVSFGKRAFFLSSEKTKAGMALEGSLVLPAFLFFIMTALLSLEAVRFQSQMQEALHQTGNRDAFLEYQVKYSGKVRENTSAQIKEYLGNQTAPYLCIQGGQGGIALQNLSDLEKGTIEYKVTYSLKSFINWIPIGDVTINDRFFSHGWTGYRDTKMQEEEKEQEIYVYITRTGSKYHLSSDCTYLRIKIQAVDYSQTGSLRNSNGGKYYACIRCGPLNGGTVYITSDGGSFHGQADCSSLKRTVYMVPLNKIAGYKPCSKCAG